MEGGKEEGPFPTTITLTLSGSSLESAKCQLFGGVNKTTPSSRASEEEVLDCTEVLFDRADNRNWLQKIVMQITRQGKALFILNSGWNG